MSWVELVRAMNRARSNDHKWDALRPEADGFIQRGNSRIDGVQADAIFNAMRKYTPGLPAIGIDEGERGSLNNEP